MKHQIALLIMLLLVGLIAFVVCSPGDDDDNSPGSGQADDDDTSVNDDDDDATGNDDDLGDDDDSQNDDDDDSSDDPPGWENLGKPFLQAYCIRCHADPPSLGATYPLETYEELRLQVSAVFRRTVLLGEMPPDEPVPTEKEVENFGLWLKLGAPK